MIETNALPLNQTANDITECKTEQVALLSHGGHAMLCDSLWLASENDSLQLTRQSLMVVLISLYYSNIRIFFRRFFGRRNSTVYWLARLFSADKNLVVNLVVGGRLGVYTLQHKENLMIFPLILQTITITKMLNIKWEACMIKLKIHQEIANSTVIFSNFRT